MTVLEQLAEFIEGANSRYTANSWLSDDKMNVYVRKGFHVIANNKAAWTLDIASVVVHKQKQGTWTDFIHKAHELNPWEATFVECVHNPILAAWLGRNGWQVAPGLIPESFFLLTNKTAKVT